MSGGVDSSVSARLLVEQGHEVIGLFMRTGVHVDETCEPSPAKPRGCCSAIDAGDAQRVADRLNIPFHALNFEEDFERIQDYFVDEYLRGRTPNPCAVCNTWLKFGRLWEYARSVDADAIATGHYARIIDRDGQAELHRGVDPGKDQSYFLFGVSRSMLPHVIFPVGGLRKSEVRRLARDFGLPMHDKPDSQEICFVPSGNYLDVVHRRRPEAARAAGTIVDLAGRRLGEHDGVSRFTIGQRRGLGIALGEPRYVVEIKANERQVVVGPPDLLLRDTLEASAVNWLIDPPTGPIRCQVKIRYLHAAAWATATAMSGDRVIVTFDEPQSAIAPGQAAVFFDGTRVVGGGWIA
jgi:tRNA-specific 2-thiouridylase